MNNTLLYRTRCPECYKKGKDTSGDNLAVYSDGHSFCYSCGFYTKNSLAKLKNTIIKKELNISLPEDLSDDIRQDAFNWLLKYFYTDKIPTVYWSDSKQYLIFIIWDKEQVIAWQARYFGTNPKHPKWISFGINESLIYIKGKKESKIILVEDIISTIKIGYEHQALCLFGSNLSTKRLTYLRLIPDLDEVYVWLDYDKRSEAILVANRAMHMGFKTKVIHTKKDPKEYTFLEIQNILDNPCHTPNM